MNEWLYFGLSLFLMILIFFIVDTRIKLNTHIGWCDYAMVKIQDKHNNLRKEIKKNE